MADKAKSTQYKRQFNATNYDRIEITTKKGTKPALQQVATNKGDSINGYIKKAVEKQYKADTGEEIDL